MPESDAMPPAESSVKSTLDKPLHLLTEDDIAQLTREDCRRYLKEKGMRRPSWNKSQAIQQVIVLKKLLETAPDSDPASRKRLRVSRPNVYDDTVPESVSRGRCGDAESSEPPEATASYRRKDLDRTDSSGWVSGSFATASNEPAQPRPKGSTNIPAGQMTIFYCGKVNVYDDVQPDKAQAIMHIAGSPLEFPREQPVDSTMEMQPLLRFSKAVNTSIKEYNSAPFVLPSMQRVKPSDNFQGLREESSMLHEETPVDGPSRKASVQRYLEKRKDRFKSKRKEGMISPTSMEMYFNQPMCNQMTSGKCSPTKIRPPSTPTRCSSLDNDSIKNVRLSAFMNDKGQATALPRK